MQIPSLSILNSQFSIKENMFTNLRIMLGLVWKPITAISRLREKAPVGSAILWAWLSTITYILPAFYLLKYVSAGGSSTSSGGSSNASSYLSLLADLPNFFFTAAMASTVIVLFIAVVYVPIAMLIANVFEHKSNYSEIMKEEFASTTSCALASFGISLLAMVPLAAYLGSQLASMSTEVLPAYFMLLILMPLPVFAALMTLVLGSVFRIGVPAAVGATLISLLSLIGLPLFMNAVTFLCASPLLLLLLIFLLRDKIDGLMHSAKSRQSLKRNLDAATLNPADASAHYNLGLYYHKRGDNEAARQSLEKTIEIDNQETDAHYQLGIIAREDGRLADAINRFEAVVAQDPNHSQHEVWRETALVYYNAGQFKDALEMLDRFLDERPSDAQGHYWRGMSLHMMGRTDEAVDEMRGCIESVKTAPGYKYRTERQWLYQAQNFLRERQ